MCFDLQPQVPNRQRVLERGEANLLTIPKDFCTAEHSSEMLFEESFSCVLWNESNLLGGDMTAERYMVAGHVVVLNRPMLRPGLQFSHRPVHA